jgi:hypothetical protein
MFKNEKCTLELNTKKVLKTMTKSIRKLDPRDTELLFTALLFAA